MKRTLIARARRGLTPGAMLCLVLNMNACNTKSPSVTITGREGADAEATEYQEVSGDSTSKPAPPKPPITSSPELPITHPDPDESASVPTPVTGAPVADNKKSNGEQVIENGRYFIKAAGSKKCISLPNDSRDPAVQFVQRTCDYSNSAMKFEIYISTTGYFLIYNVGTGMVMEIRDQMPVMQAPLQQNNRAYKDYQDFVIKERSDGRYNIKTRLGGMFVDLAGASVDEGALVQLWDQSESSSAMWLLERVP